MPSLFTRIVNGEVPSHKVAENEKFLAFLDVNPLAIGHTLVIPKKEVDYIFDVEDREYQEMWLFAKSVAKRIEKAIRCQRIGIAVIGLEVRHAHIHLVPINNVSDINFSREKLKISQEDLAETARRIREIS